MLNTNTLHEASRQWASRPDDERFLSLTDMLAHFNGLRVTSRGIVAPSGNLSIAPSSDNKGLALIGKGGVPYTPTHWAFGQLATLAGAPAGYLRELPAPIAADCINFGLRFKRETNDVGLLLQAERGADGTWAPQGTLRAATGPRYGRIWNSDVVGGLVKRFGDGRTGNFRVPGEFGKKVAINKGNTTLYASDRDMFVFLADEDRRITVPNRRDGKAGTLARGFFVWNSEVGAQVFGLKTFLFDFVCCNRIVWGAQDAQEIRIRHTSGAPERILQEIAPALETYARSSTASVTKAIEDARKHRIVKDLEDFLASRFGKGAAGKIAAIHKLEEGQPIETRWDVVVGATAYARGIPHQDARVDVETEAGKLLVA